MGVAHMDDGGRRCALPGCDRVISPTDGRPERRYCTAAHRAAARQARRAAARTAPESGPAPLVEALPWLHDAPDAGVRAPAAPPDPPAARTRHRRLRPRGRALAAIGIAGVLAGGYAIVRPAPSPSTVAAMPQSETADTWAARATVALTSVNRELDVLAQAEEEWRRLPESRRAVVPAPVVALEERRSVLERRRATLQSQLDAYRSLRRAQQELAVSEQQLRAVEKALAEAPRAQDAATAALEEQRDLRLRRRDAQRAELASLEDGVAAAARAPLPDDDEATEEVSREVREVVRNGGTEPARPTNRPAVPDPESDAVPVPVPVPDPRAGPEPEAAPDPDGGSEEPEDGDPGPASSPEDPAARPDGGAAPTSDPRSPAPPSGTDDEEMLADLRERAVEVARQARRAEAAYRAGPAVPPTPSPAAGPTDDAGDADP